MPDLLEVSEFLELPQSGTINPNRLRFAQPEISKDFSNPVHGDVYKLATSLAANIGLAQSIPPIEIGEFNSMIWSFDTRRLAAFQMAKRINDAVQVRYIKLTASGVKAKLDNFGANGSRGGLVIGVRQGGKHSTRLEHRNPDFEGYLLGSNLDLTNDEIASATRIINSLTG